MNERKPRKAKRVLSNIDFTKSDSHIALVAQSQGGPANGADYALVLKANKFSAEFVEKAAKVRVTMDMEEFLTRFFHLYYEDAEVLARALGFDEDDEGEESESDEPETYEDYINQRVANIEIMKSVKSAENLTKGLSELDEDKYYNLLLEQEKLESVLKGLASDNGASQASTVTLVENKQVEPTGSEVGKTENESMTQKTEMVEKSQLESLQKSLDDTKELLKKALADVEVYKAKEKEAVEKARFAKVVEAVKDEDKAKVLFKSLKLVESDEDFDTAVATLAAMATAVEKSALFREQGATGETKPDTKESAVAKALKARLPKK